MDPINPRNTTAAIACCGHGLVPAFGGISPTWQSWSLSTNEHPKTGYSPIQSMIIIFFIVSWPWNAAKVPLLLAKLTQTKYVQISKLKFSCQPYSCWTPYSKFNNPLYIPYCIATTSQFYIPIISAVVGRQMFIAQAAAVKHCPSSVIETVVCVARANGMGVAKATT